MIRLWIAESKKVKWYFVLFLILMDVLVSLLLAARSVRSLTDYFAQNWTTLYFQAVLFHGMFFLPLFGGLFASFLCFYEHKNDAWKQLFTLPFPRWKIYLSKFMMLITLLAITQIFFFIGYLVTGMVIQVEGEIPIKMLLLRITGGFFACFPLAMLQLGLSMRFKSFGSALLLSVCMVIPNIVLTGLDAIFGAWLPFTLPYYAMFPQGLDLSPRVEPVSFSIIIFITFFIYMTWAIRSFIRKDSLS